MGPFVDYDQVMADAAQLTRTVEATMQHFIVRGLEKLHAASPNTRILLVPGPSGRETMDGGWTAFPAPAPQISLGSLHDPIAQWTPNPAVWTMQGILTAGITEDILFHLSAEELSNVNALGMTQDRFSRLVGHLFRQRRLPFYTLILLFMLLLCICVVFILCFQVQWIPILI